MSPCEAGALAERSPGRQNPGVAGGASERDARALRLGTRQLKPPRASQFYHTALATGQQSGWSADGADDARRCQGPRGALKRLPTPAFLLQPGGCSGNGLMQGNWGCVAAFRASHAGALTSPGREPTVAVTKGPRLRACAGEMSRAAAGGAPVSAVGLGEAGVRGEMTLSDSRIAACLCHYPHCFVRSTSGLIPHFVRSESHLEIQGDAVPERLAAGEF